MGKLFKAENKQISSKIFILEKLKIVKSMLEMTDQLLNSQKNRLMM